MGDVQLAIFASGSGSNARKILEYFREKPGFSVSLVVTNKQHAGVINHAVEFEVPYTVVSRAQMQDEGSILDLLKSHGVDVIVLAGFLLLVPPYLVEAYPQRILNIHPALLPAYGGKGMYGMHVHRAVKAAGEPISGMTIHLVNQNYDEGKILFQASVQLGPSDSPEDIASKVLALEHKYYPPVIEDYLVHLAK